MAAWITGFFAAFFILLTVDWKVEHSDPDQVYSITNASLQTDILHKATIEGLKQLHGVRITYVDRTKIAYYFEYEANVQDTLKVIGSLPFVIDDNASSLECTLMESKTNPLETMETSEQVREATAFFWNLKPSDFIFYECAKSPLKHTLLISKTSSRILHKIESI
jgi:hypothetical protein